ncbi:MAG: DUF1772 domain-containing protein, partial [Luteitalea sp.]|nr:DUF1772 domain-containing protein [Luteitalea sp.]
MELRATMETIGLLDFLTLVSAIGCGLVAGIFFAFSTSVMKALGNLPPEQGIAAMQSINVAIINPWFLTPFLGTAVTCVSMAIASLVRWDDPRAWYWLGGGVVYIVGVLLVTMIFNVPRNDALAAVAPASSKAATLWVAY